MAADLSRHHKPITKLFNWPSAAEDWSQYRLADEQLEFFHTHGYLAGIRVLDDQQIEALRAELAELINPNHPGHDLFYEFHSNESTEPGTVLFHALGAWRITPGFHDRAYPAPGGIIDSRFQTLGLPLSTLLSCVASIGHDCTHALRRQSAESLADPFH